MNALCPGFFATRISDGAFDDPDFVKTVSDFIPLRRPAAAEEIKGAAIFLASPASDYICGRLLVTDGGILAKLGGAATRLAPDQTTAESQRGSIGAICEE